MRHHAENSEHRLDNCIWWQKFDDAEQAPALQNRLGLWSHNEMLAIIQQVLDAYCPEDETWRIDSLEIDLGAIEFGDIDIELPGRFRDRLDQAIRHFLSSHQRPSFTVDSAGSDKMAGSDLESLEQFLSTGTLPWWANEETSHRQILLSLVSDAPVELAAMLRKSGKKESVRRRMVMQWQEPLLKHVVQVLEPHHHEYIAEFTGSMQAYSQAGGLGLARDSGFTGNLWLWVLTQLIVERGTLFNTVEFVRSTLTALARHYNTDFENLIAQVLHASQQLNQLGANTPQFVQALRIIDRQTRQRPAPQSQLGRDDRSPGRAGDLAFLSAEGQSDAEIIDEFVQQLHCNPQKIVALLRSAKSKLLIRRLAGILHENDLFVLCENLSPGQAGVFMQFSKALEQCLPDFDCSARQRFWTTILHFAAETTTTTTSLAALVDRIIELLDRQSSITGHDLLISIANFLAQQNSCDARTLHIIFHGLVLDALRKPDGKTGYQGTGIWQRSVLQYLSTGRVDGLLVKQSRHEVFQLLRLFVLGDTRGTVSAIRKEIQNTNDLSVACEHLLELLGPPGFERLVKEMASPIAKKIQKFERQLLLARQRGLLPSWNGLEFVCVYRRLVLHALISNRGPITFSRFLTRLSRLMLSAGLQSHSAWLSDLAGLDMVQGRDDLAIELRTWLQTQTFTTTHLPCGASIELHPAKYKKFFASKKNRSHFERFISEGVLHKFGEFPVTDEQRYFNYLLQSDPKGLRSCLRGVIGNYSARSRINALVRPTELLDAMETTHCGYLSDIRQLRTLFRCLEVLRIPNISSAEIRHVLTERLLELWVRPVWSARTITELARYMGRYLLQQKFTAIVKVQAAVRDILESLPAVFQDQLRQSLALNDSSGKLSVEGEALAYSESSDRRDPAFDAASEPGRSRAINNAGLVLLGGFLETYFSRIGLITDRKFPSQEHQRRAVHYLQFLVNGQTHTEEQHLSLNKLICGIPQSEPLTGDISMSVKEIELAESLIKAVIGHWNAIGESSIDGFRGNWLVRDGALIEQEEKWTLMVEKRAYDILLQKLPFTFSITSFPWMTKPLYTIWI